MSVAGDASFAFAAGLLTFFSPCVFALLPGYIGYYVAAVDRERAPLPGAFARGLAASGGALATFALLSFLAVLAGETLERALADVIEPVIGVVLIVLGGLILWKGALSVSIALPARRTSILGFGLFGVMYAFAATACVLPLFLAVAVQSFALSTAGTLLVLGAYAGAFAILMLSATLAVAVGQEALLGRFAGRAQVLTKVAGLILIAAGFVQLYIAFNVAPIEPLVVGVV